MSNAGRIEHINVDNETQIYEEEGFIPDVILAIDMEVKETQLECHGEMYEWVKQCGDNVQIYMLEEDKYHVKKMEYDGDNK